MVPRIDAPYYEECFFISGGFMGKNRKKNSLQDIRNLAASSFLKRYYGISHEQIASMTHRNMKILFPQ